MRTPGDTLRLDLFLWYARFARSRSNAQAIAETGMLRIDGRRIERAHCPVRVGNILAFPLHGQIRILRVEALPVRRGPPAEAQALYTLLEPGRSSPVDEAGSPA